MRYSLEHKAQSHENILSAARSNPRESTLRKEVSQLKRLLADKTMEVDFFKGALQKVEARRQKSGTSGEKASRTSYLSGLGVSR